MGKTAVMFIDDIAASGRDQFGTQTALELLRQWCSVGGWHDEYKGYFKEIVDMILVGCATTNAYLKA